MVNCCPQEVMWMPNKQCHADDACININRRALVTVQKRKQRKASNRAKTVQLSNLHIYHYWFAHWKKSSTRYIHALRLMNMPFSITPLLAEFFFWGGWFLWLLHSWNFAQSLVLFCFQYIENNQIVLLFFPPTTFSWQLWNMLESVPYSLFGQCECRMFFTQCILFI